MSSTGYITKGSIISFSFLVAKELGTYSIAGAQTKVLADEISGTGVVRNVWADDPRGKTNLRFNVEMDDGTFTVVPVRGLVAVHIEKEDGTLVRVPTRGIDRIDP